MQMNDSSVNLFEDLQFNFANNERAVVYAFKAWVTS